MELYLVLFGWLVEFYGISTFVGNLKPNAVHAYIKYIYGL